jgi:hypothetical protein
MLEFIGLNFSLERLRTLKYQLAFLKHRIVCKVLCYLLEWPSDICGLQVQHSRCGRSEPFDIQLSVKKGRWPRLAPH